MRSLELGGGLCADAVDHFRLEVDGGFGWLFMDSIIKEFKHSFLYLSIEDLIPYIPPISPQTSTPRNRTLFSGGLLVL